VSYGIASPSKTLISHVYRELTERYGPSYLWEQTGALPAGLRLEMHPRTRMTLLCDPELNRYGMGLSDDDLEKWFRVPVKITIDVPVNTWRLVIVTEEVIDSGTLPLEADRELSCH
jgi:hypothetical protein